MEMKEFIFGRIVEGDNGLVFILELFQFGGESEGERSVKEFEKDVVFVVGEALGEGGVIAGFRKQGVAFRKYWLF